MFTIANPKPAMSGTPRLAARAASARTTQRVPAIGRVTGSFPALAGSGMTLPPPAPVARELASDWLVSPFQPISLEQLNAQAAMLERRDNKYVVRQDALQQALGTLARHFDVLEIGGEREFIYETRYFDDAEHTSYFDHHRGRRRRCKVRMRHYVGAGLCFVEIKLKDKRGITVKKRLKVPPSSFGTLDATALDFVKNAYRELYGLEFTQALTPVLAMRYRRVTLVAKQGGERMTIDRALVFQGSNFQRAVDADVFIVETKSGNANGIADKILRALHQHPAKRCSKYCTGMAAVREVHKHNRFLVPMRRLGVVPSGLPACALS